MENSLFSNGSLSDFLRSLQNEIVTQISSYSQDDMSDERLPYLTGGLVTKYTLKSPVLHVDKMEVSQEERVFESGDHMGRTRLAKGHRYSVFVPFAGDSRLFDYQPSKFNFNPPSGTVSRGEIILTCDTLLGESVENVRHNYTTKIESINWYLSSVGNDVMVHNNRIANLINESVTARRAALKRSSEMLNQLGLNIRNKKE